MRHLGGSVSYGSDFGPGHDLTVRGFEPRAGLCADSLEPGACFGFCVCPSLSAPPLLMLCLCLSKINKCAESSSISNQTTKGNQRHQNWQRWSQAFTFGRWHDTIHEKPNRLHQKSARTDTWIQQSRRIQNQCTYRNQLHSYILIMKQQKDKYRNWSHSQLHQES